MRLKVWLFLVFTVVTVGCSSETREVVIQLEEQENSDQTGYYRDNHSRDKPGALHRSHPCLPYSSRVWI